ncbi:MULTISPECIES: transglutaminase-like cysteine peptidase [unclassified Novosphingobium]|uniref:transglutaminase-like cysteine peptidase n=1 Tax=Novosphingobium TaxID=165696 RepID=UPI00146D079C|nr:MULTISPECIES: transglutaminase-like cysteine peptidase [unclassified Novosphingobium]NMN07206.1 putative transglutaminase-like cysteine proteinase [Novosphingobium sp. SG919]NMN89206.1 putative transglutaminase-like cysteine proteinase [Novosphingobium sp. SG916]
MLIETPALLADLAAINAAVNADPAFTNDTTHFYLGRSLMADDRTVAYAELLPPSRIDWTGQAVAEKRRRLIAAGHGPAGLLIALATLPDGTTHPVLTADISAPQAPYTLLLDSTSAAPKAWSSVANLQFRECPEDDSWGLLCTASAA